MSSSRYRVGNDDLIERISKLERRLSALERTPQLPTSAVNSGGIVIRGGSLDVYRGTDQDYTEGLLTVGSFTNVNGQDGMSLQVTRSQEVEGGDLDQNEETVDGNSSLILATVEGEDPDFKFPTIFISDKSGHTLISDSTNARRGFSDPKMHQSFSSGTFATSTSGTFASIMTSEWFMYHPHVMINVLVNNDVGSASELRLSEIGGTTDIITESVASGANEYLAVIAARSSMNSGDGPNGNPALLSLDHRRSSGAGTIRSQVISVIGVDLSWSEPY